MARKVKNKQKTPERKDWETNHWLIYDAYLQEFKRTGKPPTQVELAKLTKLNRQTIGNHLRDTKLEHLIPSVKMRTMRVLHGLAKRAEEGYAAEVKLWMQLVENWSDKLEITGKDGEPLVSNINVTVVRSKSELIDE